MSWACMISVSNGCALLAARSRQPGGRRGHAPALRDATVPSPFHGPPAQVLVDAIADPPSSKPGLPSAGVTLLRAIVRPGNPDASGPVSENASTGFDQRTADGVNWPLLKKDLCRFKWLGDKTLSLAAAHPALGTLTARPLAHRPRTQTSL